MESHFFCFPHPDTADDSGLVAVTEEMTPALLLSAYSQGLFPWTSDPVRWYSPDPRAVFVPERVHLPRNLPKLFRRAGFTVTCDTAFTAVMQGCADAHAHDGVWITPPFIACYSALHKACVRAQHRGVGGRYPGRGYLRGAYWRPICR